MEKETLLEADLAFQQALYKYFINNYRNKFSQIADIIKSDDTKEAYRLVHSIKGNAAQIGKNNLKQAAYNIECILKDGKNTVTDEQLKYLEDELNIALNEIELIINKEQ
ncbi:MAG: Hpt domain-containing protein [Treponema sp.]|nr:Hpt domain-containing protein [Treponema sp.]